MHQIQIHDKHHVVLECYEDINISNFSYQHINHSYLSFDEIALMEFLIITDRTNTEHFQLMKSRMHGLPTGVYMRSELGQVIEHIVTYYYDNPYNKVEVPIYVSHN